MQVLQRSEADLSAAEHIHAYSKTVPNWSKVQQAVANAAMDGVQLQAAACTFTAPTEAYDTSSEPMETWSIAMEAAVTSILLWAQAAQASGPTKDSKNGKHSCKLSILASQPGRSCPIYCTKYEGESI